MSIKTAASLVARNVATAVVNLFTAEGQTNEYRTALCLTYKARMDEAKKAPKFNLKTWHSEQIAAAIRALETIPGIGEAYMAMTEEERAEYAEQASKSDPVRRLIARIKEQPQRMSEIKRVACLIGQNEYADQMARGEITFNEALECIRNESASAKKGAEKGEGEGAEGEGAEQGEVSLEQQFASTVLAYAKKGLTVEAMAEIIARTMTATVEAK